MTIEARIKEVCDEVLGVSSYTFASGPVADLKTFLESSRIAGKTVFLGSEGFEVDRDSTDPFTDSYSLFIRDRSVSGEGLSSRSSSGDYRRLRAAIHESQWEELYAETFQDQEAEGGHTWTLYVSGGGPLLMNRGYDAYMITFKLG